MASYQNPKVTNPILDDVNTIRELAKYNAKLDPSLGEGLETGMIRLADVSGGKQFQMWNGSTWVKIGKLINDADTVDGKHISTSAVQNTIPVYNTNAELVGSITGNAATATALKTARTIDLGGQVASTAQSFDGSANITIPVTQLLVNNETDTAVKGTLTPLHGGTGRTDGASLDVIVDSLAGQVKASEYGQIGRAKQITASTDFNTLIVDGNYASNGVVAFTVAANNAPYTGSYSANINVVSNGNMIRHMLNIGSSIQYTRHSLDGGASWSGWMSIGGTKDSVTIYVSKSGSDNNTGYDSAYPVATIARAIQIAKGTMPRASNGSVALCIGEGNWGDVSFYDLPFLIQIYPFDKTTPLEYSTSIPVFGNVVFRNTRADIFGIIASCIECGYQSEVYIGKGYKKIGRFYIVRDGFIEFASDNSETNVLDIFENSINSPVFDVYAGGTVYIAGYLHILLSENINKTFVSIGQFGHFYTYNGRCVFDSTDAVNTGKKAVLYHNANFDTNELGSNTLPTFLTSTLPGTGYTIEKGATINGIPYGTAWDDDVLHLSGGTMTGTILTTANATLRRKGSDGFIQISMEHALNGGRLNLFGKDYSTAQYAGGFELITSDGTTLKSLLGKTTGELIWNGSSIVVSNGSIYTRSIELSMNTPFIDFHFNNSTSDYTSRIIETDSGVLSVNGVKFKSNSFTAYASSVIETSSGPSLSLRSTGSDGHKKCIKASPNGNLDFLNENLKSGGCYIPSTYMSSEGTWNPIAVFSGGKLVFPNGSTMWVA